MNWFTKLNPANSLFGRIFFWFWVTTLLMVGSALWLANQFNQSYTIRPIDPTAQQRLVSLAKRLELVAQRRPAANLSMLLSRAGQRDKVALLLIQPQTKQMVYGFPRAMSPPKEPFYETLGSSTPFQIETRGGVFAGPIAVSLNSTSYQLYAGKPPPAGMFRRLQRQHPGLLIGVSILLSGGLCALLAWSLAKPIRELQQNAQNLAQGTLSSRVQVAQHRGDELGQLARDFNLMATQLESLLGSQKRLVADISHELRSPLTRLQLAIGIVLNKLEQKGEVDNLASHLQRIEKEAQQMEEMIAQVLKLSRLEANMAQESKQMVSLKALLEPMLLDCQFEAQGWQKSLIYSDIPDVEISCYGQLLSSAVLNLVRNGLKYAQSEVQVSVEHLDSKFSIVVSDDGPGVPEQELQAIFKPFYRLSMARDRDSGGAGLGLAIAQQAILQHNGTLTASNLSPNGLQVRIELPE